jgi:hypothetical protein
MRYSCHAGCATSLESGCWSFTQRTTSEISSRPYCRYSRWVLQPAHQGHCCCALPAYCYTLRLKMLAVLLQVLKFLQAQPPDDIAPMLQAGQVPDITAGVPPMLAHTRERLQQFYQPYNQQLAELLSDDRYSRWT